MNHQQTMPIITALKIAVATVGFLFGLLAILTVLAAHALLLWAVLHKPTTPFIPPMFWPGRWV